MGTRRWHAASRPRPRKGKRRIKFVSRPARVMPLRKSSPVKSEYDIFLCHNSADKPVVRRLRSALIKRRRRPWFDEKDLVPGRLWQEALESTIRSIGCVAVLVGASGIGPWADAEMRAFLNECTRRKDVTIIPVLLPGAPPEMELPLFLQAYTWIDMRQGIRWHNLDRLIWGITGIRP